MNVQIILLSKISVARVSATQRYHHLSPILCSPSPSKTLWSKKTFIGLYVLTAGKNGCKHITQNNINMRKRFRKQDLRSHVKNVDLKSCCLRFHAGTFDTIQLQDKNNVIYSRFSFCGYNHRKKNEPLLSCQNIRI